MNFDQRKEIAKVEMLCDQEKLNDLIERYMQALLMNWSAPMNIESLLELAFDAAKKTIQFQRRQLN